MQKLLQGIVEFRHTVRPGYRERFAHLALGQSPDCLFVACSDSRVVPNLFASTEPGDLFVVRNVGNLVPPTEGGRSVADLSEAAAVEFAVDVLGVKDIVVCGHSSCGAMRAALAGDRPGVNLGAWLDLVGPSLQKLHERPDFAPQLPDADRLSQLHVLQQLEHLRTYPSVARARPGLHAWWFDLAQAEVLAYAPDADRFDPITGPTGPRPPR